MSSNRSTVKRLRSTLTYPFFPFPRKTTMPPFLDANQTLLPFHSARASHDVTTRDHTWSPTHHAGHVHTRYPLSPFSPITTIPPFWTLWPQFYDLLPLGPYTYMQRRERRLTTLTTYDVRLPISTGAEMTHDKSRRTNVSLHFKNHYKNSYP